MLSNLKNKVIFIKKTIFIVLILISISLNSNIAHSEKSECNDSINKDTIKESNCDQKRVINILLLYDAEMLLDREWQNNIFNRLEEINKFYYENYKIEWRITDTQKFKFDKNIDNLSSLFSLHKKEISKLTDNIKAEVVLAIIERDIKGIGIASTFSNVVMVSDSSKFKNYINSVVVAHEFGHLFGAWHTQRKNDFMLFSGANKLLGSKESNTIIKLMRDYNFDSKAIINNHIILNRISRLYSRHHAKGEIDPVARLLTDEGNSLYLEKKYSEAIKILKKSNNYYGRWGNTRMILSKSYYELDLLQDSFTEYTRAVFFGSKPDKEHENNLRNKF
ncbi:MAG: M12 family metallo-peptidase, partial [Alphaproteobacteria bacterium]|nr:M12 family metallo-peptidase [Alphaproteobacteria bacterium]